MQNLTFAEAYNLQIKLRESSSRKFSQPYQRVSEEEVAETLSAIVLLLEEERSSAILKQIKHRLKLIPHSSLHLVSNWQDKDGLDILHHSILNNCPELVEILLMEPRWFPPSHMPSKNPYAHLAAMCGYTACLRLILQYRPSDFFSGTNSSHVIKLPPRIKKRLKLPEFFRSKINKHIDKLLHRIKSSTETAESAMLASQKSDMNDVGNVLLGQLEELEKISKTTDASKKRTRNYTLATRRTQVMHTSDLPTTASPGSFSQTQRASMRYQKSVKKEVHDGSKPQSGQKSEKAEKLKIFKHHKCLAPKSTKHTITVYRNMFSEAPEGVIKGAGEEVSVKYSEPPKSKPFRFEDSGVEHKFLTTGDQKVVNFPPIINSAPETTSDKQKYVQRASVKKDKTLPKVMEVGVRGKKKYKEFHLAVEPQALVVKEEVTSLRNKTPLSLAAQFGHLECVQMILETFIMKNNPTMAVKEPLTLATKAKSPDAIALLMEQRITRTDYQSAVLTAIREMYPDCLTALLVQKGKERQSLFDGVNLYHILYSQSLMAEYRYEMLPIMTNVLINSNEDVNAHNVPCTFPMYTLINCAFNISIGKKIFYYVECLKILLENKANPHFDEEEALKLSGTGQAFSRNSYSSAINCIIENAVNSIDFFENTYCSKIFMKKLVTTVTTCDRTNRRLLNDVLFNYMNAVCSLGLDRYITKCLLRYGANSDFRSQGMYAINVYFENMLPYLAKFEVKNAQNRWQQELDALMLVCRDMSYKCLKEAEVYFLKEHLQKCPIQGLPLCRYFAYHINTMLMSPRPLTELVAHFIWVRLRRNEKRVKLLNVSNEIMFLIVP